MADGVESRAYPTVLEHLRRQLSAGRRPALLSGNLSPLLGELAGRLGCGVIATDAVDSGGVYTGRVAGRVCVGEEKRRRLLVATAAARPDALVGVGNSKYDVPFLSEVFPRLSPNTRSFLSPHTQCLAPHTQDFSLFVHSFQTNLPWVWLEWCRSVSMVAWYRPLLQAVHAAIQSCTATLNPKP